MTPEFWEVIEDTRPDHHNPSAHAQAITSRLADSGIEAVRAFAAGFDEAMDGLYTWDLWGAAFLSFGGCSDDAFEYLRAWLIGRGKAVTNRARTDPEGLFLDLLDQSESPESRWEELGLGEGEALLYATGLAHEQLTDEWLPARSRPLPEQPEGDPWEEDELADRFPALHMALPEDWWGSSTDGDDAVGDERLRVMLEVDRGLDAFLAGNHVEADHRLAPIVEDPGEWTLVPPKSRTDIAYVVGIGRLLAGDVEGASSALRRVESELGEAAHVRRLLVQVELARGDLDSAARWIDISDSADRLDRVLAAKLAWRQGARDEAIAKAGAELTISSESDEHAWDVAGSIQQVGRILADAGDVDGAARAVEMVRDLIADSPADLPLHSHLALLEASVIRLQGRPAQALELIEQLSPVLEGDARAECRREKARAERDLGLEEQAAASYRNAIEEFIRAGERWESEATGHEAGL